MEKFNSVILLVIFLVLGLFSVNGGVIDECLRKDSISCIQMEVYKTAKSFFDRSNIEVAGINVSNRRGKSLAEKQALEEKVDAARDVVKRQAAIENYIMTQLRHMWYEGSVSWNPQDAARSLAGSFSDYAPADVASYAGEARGKAKKQLRILLPLLIGIKLKLATFAAISYMIIAVIAKKAVLAGLISLLVSGFIAAKNLMESKNAHTPTPYHAYDSSLWPHTGLYDHDLAGHQPTPYSAKNDKQ